MSKWAFVFLFLLGLLMTGLVGNFQSAPGYMDAEYYFSTGRELAQGQGFNEPFLWNYLDDPQGLPHPSHAYWLPLTSLLAAAGMKLGNSLAFHAAQFGFILCAAGLPVLTAALAFSLTQKTSSALLAGILAIFSIFYIPFLPTTDTFALYMLLGGAIIFVPAKIESPLLRAVILGLLAGLMYLSRADGLLWLLIALWMLNCDLTIGRMRYSLVLLVAFSLLALPWMLRNYSIWGTPFSPGGAAALWFTDYDQLFAFPAAQINFSHWLQSGFAAIMKARLWALGQNLQTALAVQGEIFLTPLIILGAWRLWHQRRVQVGIAAWGLTLIAMTFVFPYAGARGGFFHSGAALQTLFWALAAVGLDVFLEWGVRVRHWSPRGSRIVFSGAVIGFAALLSVYLVGGRVLGWGAGSQPWGAGQAAYVDLQVELQRLDIPTEAIILVNNPPGFYLASQRPAIVIPDGDMDILLAVARRYGAQIVLLESNHPRGLDDLYNNPTAYSQFELLWSDGESHILQIVDGGDS
ncbi:MAG: hypothetical protein H8E28_01835 [Anaerolineae bacterium]|nr:hypothetical protein [Anaerolineae bacterium]